MNISSAIGRPMMVSWISQAAPIQRPDAHQPTKTTGPVSGVSCAKCGTSVSAAEARFCRFNKPRFDGQVYCIPCQQIVAPLAKRSRLRP